MEQTVMDRARGRTSGPRGTWSHALKLSAAVGATLAATVLWPAASLAGTLGDCMIGSSWTMPAVQPQSGLEAQVLALTNLARAANGGLPPLVASPTLTASAEWKASDMGSFSYMNHPDPAPYGSGTIGQADRNPFDRDRVCGYPAAAPSSNWVGAPAGENVAYGQPSPQAVVDAWMASLPHRTAILNPAFVVMGNGAAMSSTGVMYWAQTFGSLNDAAPAATAVRMRSFSAKASKHGVLLRWRTASEIDTAGFKVFREVHGKRVRANARFIASKSVGGQSASGHRYSFLDRHAPRGKAAVRYLLQSIDLDATKNWAGATVVSR